MYKLNMTHDNDTQLSNMNILILPLRPLNAVHIYRMNFLCRVIIYIILIMYTCYTHG